MFERDYIMKLIMDLAASISRSISYSEEERDPMHGAETLDDAVGCAVNMDAATFLSLTPDSISSIMRVSGTHERASEYIARSLLLASHYYEQAGEQELAKLRLGQAMAVAREYGCDVSDMLDDDGRPHPSIEDSTRRFLQEDV